MFNSWLIRGYLCRKTWVITYQRTLTQSKTPLRQAWQAISQHEKFREEKIHICITVWLREVSARTPNTNVSFWYDTWCNPRGYEFKKSPKNPQNPKSSELFQYLLSSWKRAGYSSKHKLNLEGSGENKGWSSLEDLDSWKLPKKATAAISHISRSTGGVFLAIYGRSYFWFLPEYEIKRAERRCFADILKPRKHLVYPGGYTKAMALGAILTGIYFSCLVQALRETFLVLFQWLYTA